MKTFLSLSASIVCDWDTSIQTLIEARQALFASCTSIRLVTMNDFEL